MIDAITSSRPTRIIISGRPWSVEFVPEETFKGIDSPNSIGLTLSEELRILIANWIHVHVQKEVLLHEIMHAALFGTLPHHEPEMGFDHEEYILSALDAVLLHALRDNSDATAWLLS